MSLTRRRELILLGIIEQRLRRASELIRRTCPVSARCLLEAVELGAQIGQGGFTDVGHRVFSLIHAAAVHRSAVIFVRAHEKPGGQIDGTAASWRTSRVASMTRFTVLRCTLSFWAMANGFMPF